MHRFDNNDSIGSTRINKLQEYLLAMFSIGLLSVVAPAVLAGGGKPVAVDPSYCLKIAVDGARPDKARCPAFMADGLAELARDCREVDGKLIGESQGRVYALDIDGDRRAEYLYRFDANFSCAGAPSYFACGSSDCPFVLFRETTPEGAPGAAPQVASPTAHWLALGQFPGTDIVAIPGSGIPGYPDLKMACAGLSFCDAEFYRWDGKTYSAFAVMLRGTRVDLFDSSMLASPKQKLQVLAAPASSGKSLGEYDSDAIFVVMGRVPDGNWLLVSPCSACESGFVAASGLSEK